MFLMLLSFLVFVFVLVKTMMLGYLACFGGSSVVFLTCFLRLFKLKCVTPLLLETAGYLAVDLTYLSRY